jgi:hypothetical protein
MFSKSAADPELPLLLTLFTARVINGSTTQAMKSIFIGYRHMPILYNNSVKETLTT